MIVRISPSLQELITKVKVYNKNVKELEQIEQAYHFADRAHTGQKRMSGDDYIIHPLATAFLLAEWKTPYSLIVAGLLHDVIEDTDITFDDIKDHFGIEVANLVQKGTKLKKISYSTNHLILLYHLNLLFSAPTISDNQAIFLKLADRFHNLLTIKFLKPDKQKLIAQQSLEFYVPLAHSLGLSFLVKKYSDICYQVLYPQEYSRIKNLIKKEKIISKKIITDLKLKISQLMFRNQLKVIKITTRIKEAYSVFKKIKQNNIKIGDIYDLLAIRIITNTKDNCYKILGAIHSEFIPVNHRFKDYIAKPKSNSYQSIHTGVILPNNKLLEVQIRTKTMDQIAQYGAAAHWRYKLSTSNKKLTSITSSTYFSNFKNLFLDQFQNQDFLNSEKISQKLYQEIIDPKIYVCFQGKIMEIPKDSSVIDFAYLNISNQANYLHEVLVNGRLIDFAYSIEAGDIIKFKLTSLPTVQPWWLDYARTIKTKLLINQALKDQKSFFQIKGMKINQKFIKLFNCFVDQKMATDSNLLINLVSKLKNIQDDDQKKIWKLLVNQKISIAELGDSIINESWRTLIFQKTMKLIDNHDILADNPLKHQILISKCCLPIFNESIGGLMNRQIIYAHRLKCLIFQKRKDSLQFFNLYWKKQQSPNSNYLTRIKVHTVSNIPGNLQKITSAIYQDNINIESVITKNNSKLKQYFLIFWLRVKNLKQLQRLVNNLQPIVNVFSIEREIGRGGGNNG